MSHTTFLRRWGAVVSIAFAALSAGGARAHSGSHSTDAPRAAVEGNVLEISVRDRSVARAQTFRVLLTPAAEALVLRGAAAETVAIGAHGTFTGSRSGETLTLDATARQGTLAKGFSASLGAQRTLEGRLVLSHADYYDGRPSRFSYAVVDDAGVPTPLLAATGVEGLQGGMRVAVTGQDAGGAALLPSQIDILSHEAASAKAAAKATITNSTIVIPIKFPSSPGVYPADAFSISQIQTAVFGAAGSNSVSEYYKEVSYGQQLLAGVVAQSGGGWLKTTNTLPTTCDTAAISTAADAAATAAGYNLASYQNRIYMFMSQVPGCGWTGLGYINWGRAYINNSISLLVIAHELGHNFGLLHAASLDCGTASIGGTCTSTEYGDPFDVMGNNRAMHFNSMQKSLLGWIPATSVKTHAKGSATYTLTPLETAGGSTYAVKIPASTKRTYWLEYRQPTGFDSLLSGFPNNGAQIRVASPFESLCSGCADDTEFLDMTPSTSTFTDGTLVVGQSFTDPLYGMTISVTAASPTSLTVQVASLGDATRPDFDFSGTTDLVWRSASGATVMWLMSGTSALSGSVLSADGAWTISNVADFDGNGKSDVLWRSSTGVTAGWLMNGSTVAASGILSGDPNWTITQVADFNGDGKTDVIWRNSAGVTAMWLMNGLAPSSSTILSGDGNWTLAFTGDFNGDGKSDLVWRSTSGVTAIWLMNGGSVLSTGIVGTDPNWQVVEVADVNGDGRSDLVWRNNVTGAVVVWLMNGTAVTTAAGINTDPSMHLVHAGDFDGDGKADLVWRNTSTGATSLWLMNGSSVLSKTTLTTNSSLQVQHVGDFNGDGRSDIVWRNTSTGATSLWLMNGAAVLSTVTLSADPAWSVTSPQ